jgi:flagellar biosynthesis protein FlhB
MIAIALLFFYRCSAQVSSSKGTLKELKEVLKEFVHLVSELFICSVYTTAFHLSTLFQSTYDLREDDTIVQWNISLQISCFLFLAGLWLFVVVSFAFFGFRMLKGLGSLALFFLGSVEADASSVDPITTFPR